MEEYGFEAVNVLVQEELLGQRIFPKFRKTPVKIQGLLLKKTCQITNGQNNPSFRGY